MAQCGRQLFGADGGINTEPRAHPWQRALHLHTAGGAAACGELTGERSVSIRSCDDTCVRDCFRRGTIKEEADAIVQSATTEPLACSPLNRLEARRIDRLTHQISHGRQ
eukprot:5767787-Prymnesium_polylepis.1